MVGPLPKLRVGTVPYLVARPLDLGLGEGRGVPEAMEADEAPDPLRVPGSGGGAEPSGPGLSADAVEQAGRSRVATRC